MKNSKYFNSSNYTQHLHSPSDRGRNGIKLGTKHVIYQELARFFVFHTDNSKKISQSLGKIFMCN